MKFGQNSEIWSKFGNLVGFGMNWYGLVTNLKLNSKPFLNESMNNQGGYRASRAAKNLN